MYGIVAFTGTSSDKVGRSVPAPRKGVMANVRERPAAYPSPLFDLEYRRRQISLRTRQVQDIAQLERKLLMEQVLAMNRGESATRQFETSRLQEIHSEENRQQGNILRSFSTQFWRHNPGIAPICGALATWGLTIDELHVASFHGTSTKKNELNECDIMQRQLEKLGRTSGNRVLGVFQKHLTGHPKAAAGAWMANGCLQVRHSGIPSLTTC